MTDSTRDPYLDDDTFHFSDGATDPSDNGTGATDAAELPPTKYLGTDDIIWDIDSAGDADDEPMIREPEYEPDPDETAIAVPEWSPPPDIWIG